MNEFFSDLSNLWERVAPYIFAHLLALLTLRYIVGLRMNLASRADQFLMSDRWKKWKPVLDEFELRPKLPFLAVLVVAFYFVLFQQSVSLLSQIQIPPLSFRHSEDAFWRDSKPFHDIEELAVFRNDPDDAEVWKLAQFKRTVIEELKLKYPAAYESNAGWRGKEGGRWSTYYRLALLFGVFCLVMAVRHRRDRRKGMRPVTGRLLATASLTIAVAVFARYRAEQGIEHQLRQELHFVVSHLRATTPPAQRLPPEMRPQVAGRVFRDLAGDQKLEYFWLSRSLEQWLPISRGFPRTSGQAFEHQWGYKRMPEPNPGV